MLAHLKTRKPIKVKEEYKTVTVKTEPIVENKKFTIENQDMKTLNVSEQVKETKEDNNKCKAEEPTLLHFLDLEIAEQALELECPVCLEESPPNTPIYMCEEQHPVCATCRPRLSAQTAPIR
jgi:hypothetical protein